MQISVQFFTHAYNAIKLTKTHDFWFDLNDQVSGFQKSVLLYITNYNE
jgi:hypothetical protein